MNRATKRITISVPQDLAAELAATRRTCYIDESQGEMLRDLITRGLHAWAQQNGQSRQAL